MAFAVIGGERQADAIRVADGAAGGRRPQPAEDPNLQTDNSPTVSSLAARDNPQCCSASAEWTCDNVGALTL